MKRYFTSVAIIIILCVGSISAQPIRSPYVFVQDGSDTSKSSILPEPPTVIRRVTLNGGHFDVGGKNSERIRFFGTELEYTSQFLSATDARVLAKRLHKLGFNAIRLIDNDEVWWAQGSFLDYPNATTSYNVNPVQVARFDTLLNEFKKQGIYVFLVLNSQHTFIAADGVAQPDSTMGAQYTHFIDRRAAELHRQWVKTILTHINPLTGLRLADDPVLAAVEVTSPGFSLLTGWRAGMINWVDNSTYRNGQSIGWNRSRRLDTLFSQYLLHKYGSDVGINNAWAGGAPPNPPNLIGNGSFEQVGSAIWSFAVGNGATGDKTIFSPAIDSQYCMLAIISSLSATPSSFDAYLQNTTPRLGKDTLYELSFYAKIRYSPANPVLTRSIYAYLSQYQTGINSLGVSQTIDTSWKKYTFPFRAKAGGLHTLYFALGQQLGDVMFDAVSIKRKVEYGLFPGEASSTSSIVRIKFGETDLLPRQRPRDLALFYDSLQNDYFTAIKKCITDTLKSPVLVNFYAPEYWGTLQDHYANRYSDFAQSHINTDYPHTRPGGPAYSDSTWVMLNNNILSDAGNGTMGSLAAASIAGKPFVGRFMNLVTNQQSAEVVPFFTSYASLQDWDGLFFVNYATYYEDLFANIARAGSWWSIAGSPSLLIQMPQASDAFRNQKIKAATSVDTVTHVADDVLLESVPGHYQGPFGVEGYLDPNIATQDLVRQKFDVTTPKVAAEYPYTTDTSTKISATGELRWSQTGRYFLANSNGFNAAVGVFGADTVKDGALKFRRLDNAGDLQSILLSQLSSSTMLLTTATRSQNSRAIWQYGDSSIGNHWGAAPTIMSAGKFEFFVNSDSNRLIVHPLDQTGNMMASSIEGIKITGTNTFKIAIDQSVINTPWYYIETMNTPNNGVTADGNSVTSVSIMPNPAQTDAKVKLTLANFGEVKISLFDDLGREVANVVNGELYQGSYDLPLDLRNIPAGHYTLRVDCNGKVMSRNVSVLK